MHLSIAGDFRQAFEVGEEAEKEVKVFRGQTEGGRDDLRAGLPVAVDIGKRELPGIIEVLPDFQIGQGPVFLQMNELRMLMEFQGIEIKRTEGRFDKVESGVGRVWLPKLSCVISHIG